MAEAVAALQHLDAAAAHELVGGELVDPLAVEFDRALRHLAALGMQQVGDGLQGRRLAGAVRAEQGDDAALGHGERDAFQHEDHVVVDDLDVVDREDGFDG